MNAKNGADQLCTLCGATGSRRLFAKFGRGFYRCPACAIEYLAPQPTDEELAALYTEDYYGSWGLADDFDAVRSMKLATFGGKLALVERFAKPGRLLDIGCATGFLLESARERGWQVRGVELSSYSAGVAAERLGAQNIFNGTLEAAAFPDSFFDAISMSDLIEHVRYLPSFLREVHRILRPGGLAAVLTPDVASFSRRVMGSAWPHFKTEHLYYFSVPSLRRLLEGYGFSTVYGASAPKALTLDYVARQMARYPLPLVTPAIGLLSRVLPERVRNRPFMVPTGELMLIARKGNAAC